MFYRQCFSVLSSLYFGLVPHASEWFDSFRIFDSSYPQLSHVSLMIFECYCRSLDLHVIFLHAWLHWSMHVMLVIPATCMLLLSKLHSKQTETVAQPMPGLYALVGGLTSGAARFQNVELTQCQRELQQIEGFVIIMLRLFIDGNSNTQWSTLLLTNKGNSKLVKLGIVYFLVFYTMGISRVNTTDKAIAHQIWYLPCHRWKRGMQLTKLQAHQHVGLQVAICSNPFVHGWVSDNL